MCQRVPCSPARRYFLPSDRYLLKGYTYQGPIVGTSEIHADSWLISGPLGQALCKLVSYSILVSTGVSIQGLVLIAVDRFGAVAFPLRSPLISSKLCPFFILGSWIIAIATMFPHLFAYKLVEFPERLSCELRWNEAFGKSSSYYTIALSAIELHIPFTLIRGTWQKS
ncbi:hypothetical protein ACROYT_G041249 [Oculina patagonica]